MKETWKKLKTWHKVVIIAVLFGGISSLLPKKEIPKPKLFNQMNKAERGKWLDSISNSSAKYTIQRLIEEDLKTKLKSPTTAEFSNFKSAVYNSDQRKLIYYGQVDAQNTYGAMLRSSWMAIVVISEDGTKAQVSESSLME